MILIEHPEHGRMHVYNAQELAAHEAIGWVRVVEQDEKQPKRQTLTLPKGIKK